MRDGLSCMAKLKDFEMGRRGYAPRQEMGLPSNKEPAVSESDAQVT